MYLLHARHAAGAWGLASGCGVKAALSRAGKKDPRSEILARLSPHAPKPRNP